MQRTKEVYCRSGQDDACPWGSPPRQYKRKSIKELRPVRQNTPKNKGKGGKETRETYFASPFLSTEWCGNSRPTHFFEQYIGESLLQPDSQNVRAVS